jgi:protein TonB
MDTQTLKPFSLPRTPEQRFVSIGFVILIHVALVYALINMGVIDSILPKSEKPIVIITVPPPVPPQPPIAHPKQPTLHTMENPTAIEPDILYETDAPPLSGTGITMTRGDSGPAIEAPRSIARTITRPPYPPVSRRLGEIGTVSLRLMVSEEGTVTDAIIVRSSGFARLDEAAVSWITAHWRYKPATRDGQRVTSIVNATMKFELNR